jgi:hypothetical protein
MNIHDSLVRYINSGDYLEFRREVLGSPFELIFMEMLNERENQRDHSENQRR